MTSRPTWARWVTRVSLVVGLAALVWTIRTTGLTAIGTYFRRIRLQTDGKFWENYEYTLTLALENDQFSTSGLDEFWVGATNVPLIGTARLGHVKNAIGLVIIAQRKAHEFAATKSRCVQDDDSDTRHCAVQERAFVWRQTFRTREQTNDV